MRLIYIVPRPFFTYLIVSRYICGWKEWNMPCVQRLSCAASHEASIPFKIPSPLEKGGHCDPTLHPPGNGPYMER